MHYRQFIQHNSAYDIESILFCAYKRKFLGKFTTHATVICNWKGKCYCRINKRCRTDMRESHEREKTTKPCTFSQQRNGIHPSVEHRLFQWWQFEYIFLHKPVTKRDFLWKIGGFQKEKFFKSCCYQVKKV